MKQMTDYYKQSLEKGQEYQDFIMDILQKKYGMSISCYTSKKWQYSNGESRQGVEIKFDDRMKETNNVYIEIAEKTNSDNLNFVDSGIMREDNTWLYIIGNYDKFYIHSKKYLKKLYESNKYKVITIPTSKGFLLPCDESEKYSIETVKVNE